MVSALEQGLEVVLALTILRDRSGMAGFQLT